jgi:thiosulfate/3-mercaptopyruvate sulfurtransferase
MSSSEQAYTSVIDVDALRGSLGRPDLCVVDCRHDLLHPEAGQKAYLEQHIAGAVFAHLDRDLSGPIMAGTGRHPLPDPDRLAERFRRWGIDGGTQIVVYDAHGGSFAGRLWWLARWLGHPKVALLDGGWQAALRVGLKTESGEASPAPGRFERAAPLEQTVGAVDVQSARSQPEWLLIDARAPDRYAGRNETIDPVAGHIPGAFNRFWQANLEPDGRFKTASQLRAEFAQLLGARGADHMIVQCGSGVSACHHLIAMRLAGLTGARLYPGSWSEWITDPARPVAVGERP